MLTGIIVTLYKKTKTGTNAIGEEIFAETPVQVADVLVAPVTENDIVNRTDLTGGRAVYTLAIPKGDSNQWEDAKVSFFGETWRVIGIPTEGIIDNIPLRWNKKVTVERFD